MSDYIPATLRQLVTKRAAYRCEYCLVHESDVLLSHEADHIIAQQHEGKTMPENLALACMHCNRHKGTNIASIDPDSGQLTPLFNPRTQIWAEHFELKNARIQPLTSIGQVTIKLLKLNHPDRLRVRQALIEIEAYP